MVYSNSGYFLLGLLIERVSGEPYDQYIQRHLFAPAGMQDSRYCSERAVYRRRAHGYDRDSTGLIRARFLDHTWPFSAGSICSTARDLVAWNAALHHGRILAPKAYRTMMAPGELNDGTKLRYGAGLAMADLHGHRAIYHSGLIYGFTSQLRYYPDDSLTVVVLMNTLDDASLQAIITQIADLVLGPTPPMPPRGAPEDTRPFTGHFKDLAPGVDFELTISSIPTELRVTFQGDSASALRWVGGTTFARDETFYTFVGSGDHFDELRVDNVFVYFILRRLPN